VSWLAVAGSAAPPRRAVYLASRGRDSADFEARWVWALRQGPWKIIRYHTGDLELFDLEDDPGEQRDLSVDRPFIARYLDERLRLQRIRDRGIDGGAGDDPYAPGLDEEARARLRALGYVQ
jgi:hypothetical protein